MKHLNINFWSQKSFSAVFKPLLSSLSQRWTPVSHRPGGGRRSVLSGSGGGHYWAHPPLHPSGGSQHLQRHADEPKLCIAHTSAAKLACPPHEVRHKEQLIGSSKKKKKNANQPVSCHLVCDSQGFYRCHSLCPEDR